MSVISLIGVIVASLAAGAGAATAYLNIVARRRTTGAQRFILARARLVSGRPELVEACLAAHSRHQADPDIPLLSKAGWIPRTPLTLDEVELTLTPKELDRDSLAQARAHLLKHWPTTEAGTRIPTYGDAIGALAPPKIWSDRRSYRLISVRGEVSSAEEDLEIGLDFALATYFDLINTSEPLGHELADQLVRNKPVNLSHAAYRKWLGDPFDLRRRCAIPGVNTLTIRRSASQAHMFLHERQANLATAMGAVHVTPAAEFQPRVDIGRIENDQDFNLRNNILRGYTEEFVNVKGDLSNLVDSGQLNLWFLGIGLDPLSWKPEILMVAIFEDEAFNSVFRDIARENAEGPILWLGEDRPHTQGLPFSKSTVLYHAQNSRTLPAGRACLTLAWRWRRFLRLPTTAGNG